MALGLILIILVVLSIKFIKIKFFSIEGIFTTIWLLTILGSIIFLSAKYQFYYKGIYWILVVIFVFCLGSKIGEYISYKRVIVVMSENQRNTPCIPWKLNIIFILCSLFSVLYLMSAKGISINIFTNLERLQSISHSISVTRYAGEETTTLIGQILNSFNYVTPICCGYSLNFANNKSHKIICYSSIIPLILSLLLTSAKLGLISFVILYFVGYYISYMYINRAYPSLKVRYIFLGITALIILLVIFYFSFYLRIGKSSVNVFGIILEKMYIYIFGHIQGFDIWFSNRKVDISSWGLGSNTFFAIPYKLGLVTRIRGFYEYEFGSSTNVYTYFRAMIEDFGYIFSIIILFALGLYIKYLSNAIIRDRKKIVARQWILSVLMFYIFYMYMSPFIFTSFYISFLIFAFFLYWSYYIRIVFVFGKRKDVKNN